MSTEDRQRAIGQAVEQYAENKRQLAALSQNANHLGNHLQILSDYLRRCGREVLDVTIEVRSALQNLPSVEQMRDLMGEIDTAIARRQQLRSILRDAGIDVKD